MGSRMTSTPPGVTARTASARPSSRANTSSHPAASPAAILPGRPTVPIRRPLPSAAATWLTTEPIPPLAECMSTDSPGRMRARSVSRSRAVDTTRGAEAAIPSGTSGGTSTVTAAAATATSAMPPPGVNAATR